MYKYSTQGSNEQNAQISMGIDNEKTSFTNLGFIPKPSYHLDEVFLLNISPNWC